jgi:hypothetical protein
LAVPLEVVHTAPGDVMNWEHEVFAHAGLRAATLSARRTPPPSLARSSVLDCGRAAVNATSVSRTVRLVGAALWCAGECASVRCSERAHRLTQVSSPHVLHTRYKTVHPWHAIYLHTSRWPHSCAPMRAHMWAHTSPPHIK